MFICIEVVRGKWRFKSPISLTNQKIKYNTPTKIFRNPATVEIAFSHKSMYLYKIVQNSALSLMDNIKFPFTGGTQSSPLYIRSLDHYSLILFQIHWKYIQKYFALLFSSSKWYSIIFSYCLLVVIENVLFVGIFTRNYPSGYFSTQDTIPENLRGAGTIDQIDAST